MKHEARMTIEPGARLGVLMRPVIVEDDVDDPADRNLGLNGVQETDELLVPVTLHAAPNDLAVEHVERGEQGGGAVALVVMRHRAGPPFLEFGECLRIRAASNPSSTSRWRVLATVSTLLSSAAAIWLSLQPSPPSEASAFNRIRAFSSFCAGWCPLWIRAVRCSRSSLLSVTAYFFTAISFLAINPLRQQR